LLSQYKADLDDGQLIVCKYGKIQSMTSPTPELVLDAKAQLGEGPSWDAASRTLYWINIYAGEIRAYSPETGSDRVIPVGEPVGCLAPTKAGGLVIASQSGISLLDPATGQRKLLAHPEAGMPGNRFNDGKCDPAGRFLAGTMDNAEKEASGSLYSLSPDGTLKTLLTGVRISNGLAWSPDHATLYYIDTPTRAVMAYQYDLAIGNISQPRKAIYVPEELGWPDGMTSDMDGHLWIAMWGGSALTKWDPASGRLLQTFPIPALNVTSCAFGGEGLTDLYITSARKGMSDGQLVQYPLTGAVFRLRTDVKGMPAFSFG
jgi:sugar lactone lactonase YvrE